QIGRRRRAGHAGMITAGEPVRASFAPCLDMRYAQVLVLSSLVAVSASGPAPGTLGGWARHVAIVEARMAHQLHDRPFLALYPPGRAADRDRMPAGAFGPAAAGTRD